MKFRMVCCALALITLLTLTSCDLSAFPSSGTNSPSDNVTDSPSNENNNSCKHTEVRTLIGYDATCLEAGLTEGRECISCGEIIQQQEIIEIKPHSFDDADDLVCNICGFLNSELPTFAASEIEARAGSENVAVTISLKNNPGIASIVLSLDYDDAHLDLTEIEYNSEIGGQTVYPQELESPVTLYWINGFADANGDFIFATLYFDVSSDATEIYNIQITYEADNIYNIVEENLDFEVIQGKIIIE